MPSSIFGTGALNNKKQQTSRQHRQKTPTALVDPHACFFDVDGYKIGCVRAQIRADHHLAQY